MVRPTSSKTHRPFFLAVVAVHCVLCTGAAAVDLGITIPGVPIPPEGGLRRVGSADNFPSDEDYIQSAVVDPQTGYAWFGTGSIPGQVIKVAFGNGNTPPRRVGSVTLGEGEDSLFTGVIDATAGYAYFGTFTTPAKVIKIALGEGDEPPSRVGSLALDPSESPLFCSVIDPAQGYAWFGTRTAPGHVIKIALGGGNSLPTRAGAASLEFAEANLRSAVIDPEAGYAYFGTFTDPGRVVKVALGAGTDPPARIDGIVLEPGLERGLASALIDPSAGYAWFGTFSVPGPARVVKIAIGQGNSPPVRIGSTSMDTGEDNLTCTVRDPSNPGEALFGCGTFPGQVVKVSLGAGSDLPSRVGGDIFEVGEDNPVSVAGVVGGTAFFGTNTSPGQVVRVAFGTGGAAPSRLDSTVLLRGENGLQSAVIDPERGYAWFGTTPAFFPAQVVKVSLGGAGKPPRRVSSVALNPGEERLTCAIIDPGAGYAWFGTDTSPGRVVKVALGEGDGPPQRIGAVTLNADEHNLRSAVIDPANGYGYFGTAVNPPGKVVKVALGAGNAPPVRIGATTPQADEWDFQCAVIDPVKGFALFGTGLYFFDMFSPARVVKVGLGAGSSPPQRVAGIPLGSSEDILLSAIYDPATGYAWFGQGHTVSASIIKIDMEDGNAAPRQVGSGLLLNDESPLAAAVIDPESGYGLFGAGSFPAKAIKVALGDGEALPLRTGSTGAEGVHCAVIDPGSGVAFFGSANAPGNVIKISYSQKGYIKATRILLTEEAVVQSLHFYSHSASGDLRLAVYSEDGGERNLLWQSPMVANSAEDGWLTVPVSSGAPPGLNLAPGTYWLAHQTNSAADVAGYVAGATGDGFLVPSSFAAFPAVIPGISATLTSETWSEYLSYDPVSEISIWRVY